MSRCLRCHIRATCAPPPRPMRLYTVSYAVYKRYAMHKHYALHKRYAMHKHYEMYKLNAIYKPKAESRC